MTQDTDLYASLRNEVEDLRNRLTTFLAQRENTPYFNYPPTFKTTQFAIGIIVMWSGGVSDIPGGWALCDGNNGTPDLRDKFIVGAGDTYEPEDTGGSAEQPAHTGHGVHSDHDDHTGHGIHAQHATHDSHNHTITQELTHQHTVNSDGNHRHTAAIGRGTESGTSFNSWQQDTTPQSSLDGSHNHSGQVGAAGTHNHGGSTGNPSTPLGHEAHTNNGPISAHSSHANAGAISDHETNLPPYFALCFIMRIS